MAGDLKISDAPFTTELIHPAQGDILAAAWASYLAGNTGCLACEPMPMPVVVTAMTEDETLNRTVRVFLTAGTWVAYGFVYYWPSATIMYYEIDGTEIVSGGGQGATYGTGTVTVEATGWIDVCVRTGLSGAGGDGTLAAAAFMRPCLA